MSSAKKNTIQKRIPSQSFRINDIVFAKLKGYNKWPAQIHDINNKRYTVIFFGSYDWSTLPEQAISEIGSIEKNLVVEQNQKNVTFMRAWEECVFIADRLFGFYVVDPEKDSDESNVMNKKPADAKTSFDNDMGNDAAITYLSPRCDSLTANSSDQPYTRNAASSKFNDDVDDDRNMAIANSKFPIIVLNDITHKFLKRNKTELQKNASPVNVITLRMSRAIKRKIDAQAAYSDQPREKKN